MSTIWCFFAPFDPEVAVAVDADSRRLQCVACWKVDAVELQSWCEFLASMYDRVQSTVCAFGLVAERVEIESCPVLSFEIHLHTLFFAVAW